MTCMRPAALVRCSAQSVGELALLDCQPRYAPCLRLCPPIQNLHAPLRDVIASITQRCPLVPVQALQRQRGVDDASTAFFIASDAAEVYEEATQLLGAEQASQLRMCTSSSMPDALRRALSQHQLADNTPSQGMQGRVHAASACVLCEPLAPPGSVMQGGAPVSRRAVVYAPALRAPHLAVNYHGGRSQCLLTTADAVRARRAQPFEAGM